MAKKTTKKVYYLIGAGLEKLTVLRKPPTLRHILQHFMYHHFEKSETINNAASLVIQNAMVAWNQLDVKTQRSDKCEAKLKKEYEKWHNLFRHQNSNSDVQIAKRAEFVERLDETFNVISAETPTKSIPSKSESMMTSEDEEEILDEMMYIDLEHAENEPGTSAQSTSTVTKRSSSIVATEKVKQILSGEEDPTKLSSQFDDKSEEYVERKRRKTKKIHILDGDLVTKLDALGLSDYQAVRVISEVCQALGQSLDDIVLSYSTIRRARKESRLKNAEKIKSNFSVNSKVNKLRTEKFYLIPFFVFLRQNSQQFTGTRN